MGSFDTLLLVIPLMAGFVLTAGAAFQGFKVRSYLFLIPVVLGVCSLLSSVGIIVGGPDAFTLGCISAGFWLFLGAIAYVIVNRRAQSAAQQPPSPPSASTDSAKTG